MKQMDSIKPGDNSYKQLTTNKLKQYLKGFGYGLVNDKPFIVMIENSSYKKNDIIEVPLLYNLKVLKVYKYNWYRELLEFFGIKFKNKNCIKVKNIH